ncbi:MAG TPA: hypothetical protein DF383_13680 [Deltaproteobacteria bacterium]|nr:hypothetical protein [Deltaproteobacteria bacterium]
MVWESLQKEKSQFFQDFTQDSGDASGESIAESPIPEPVETATEAGEDRPHPFVLQFLIDHSK